MQTLIQPQEIEVWYIIPKIRSSIAKELYNLKVSQIKIAKILGVTKSAVSQYINDKRAAKIDFPEIINNMIQVSAKKLSKNNLLVTDEIQVIIQKIRKIGLLCKYHKEHSKVKLDCTICAD